MYRSLIFTLALSACASPAPSQPASPVESPPPLGDPSGAPAPTDTTPTPAAPTPTPPTPDAACELRLNTMVEVNDYGTVSIHAYVQNLTSAPVEVVLPYRCPQGLLTFEGLGKTFDVWNTCRGGWCSGEREPERYTVPPESWVPLTGFTLHRAGSPPCQPPLRPRSYTVRAVPPSDQHRWCDGPATFVLEAPQPKKVDPNDPYYCEKADDCTLSCPTDNGCCGFPCGYKHAINKRHADAYAKNYAKTCDRPPCPAMGCAYQPAFGATCRDNRCVGAEGPGDF